MGKILVNEMFTSIQGEGKTVGKLAVFVRLQGCNLRCKFCDTPYTWGDEEDMLAFSSPTELVETILLFLREIKTSRVVFTGGEPMLRDGQLAETIMLLTKERKEGIDIEIETNGSLDTSYLNERLAIQGFFTDPNSLLYNFSPKLKNTGMFKGRKNSSDNFTVKTATEIGKTLDFMDVVNDSNGQGKMSAIIKFVIRTNRDSSFLVDLTDIGNFISILGYYDLDDMIYLMPMGITKKVIVNGMKRLIEWKKEAGFDYIISPRLHTMLWGNERGK
jgi:organic radical activating enzyme